MLLFLHSAPGTLGTRLLGAARAERHGALHAAEVTSRSAGSLPLGRRDPRTDGQLSLGGPGPQKDSATRDSRLFLWEFSGRERVRYILTILLVIFVMTVFYKLSEYNGLCYSFRKVHAHLGLCNHHHSQRPEL